MQIPVFELERLQSLWENRVDVNLTESGIHPYTLRELLTPEQQSELLDLRLTYGWTNGEPKLRHQIASYYQHTNGEQVLVTNGSAEANFLAMWTMLEPGDEVLYMLPNYMQIWGLAESIGVTVNTFSLKRERQWRPDLDEIRSKLTPKTKLLILCCPNNPTGAILSREEMEAIVEMAAANGTRIYADEVYKGVQLEGEELPSFRDLDENAIVTAGLSKALAHPGLRIGWLCGPQDFIDDAWHRNDYTTITTCLVSEYVANIILQPQKRTEILQRNRQMLRENLTLLQDWLAQRPDLFDFVPPQAGGMAFLKYHFDMNSTELSEWLRIHKKVLVLPGDVYGMDHHLRLGIGEDKPTLARGLELLGEGLDELRA